MEKTDPHGHSADPHDDFGDFHRDLPLMLPRRALFGFGAVAGATALFPGLASAAGKVVNACVVSPSETQGPFPADGSVMAIGDTTPTRAAEMAKTAPNILVQSGLVRTDLTRSFGDFKGTAEGVPFRLKLKITDAYDCVGLKNKFVYLWLADAHGTYSVYNHPDQNWLRGAGITDQNGEITFDMVVPGCYPGRYPHIHVQVFENQDWATSGRNALLTSQFIVPEWVCRQVYGLPLYKGSPEHMAKTSVNWDGVFRYSSPAEVAMQTPVVTGDRRAGYVGEVRVGLWRAPGDRSRVKPIPYDYGAGPNQRGLRNGKPVK